MCTTGIAANASAAAPRPAANKFGSRPKLSGHANETMIAAVLNDNMAFRSNFCARVGRAPADFVSARADGKNAPQEPSVLGGRTPAKADLVVAWKDGTTTNVSIKKRFAGQVYLVTAAHFVAAYEAQYAEKVPDEVKRALELFIGEASDAQEILDGMDVSVDGPKTRRLAHEQHNRLVFDVLRHYDPKMSDALLAWLRAHVENVVELCFAAGAVKDKSQWADVLWYRNLVDEKGRSLDFLVPISELKSAVRRSFKDKMIVPGPKNHGSTILLPFGHLQYHLGQLEFYQNLGKVRALLQCSAVR